MNQEIEIKIQVDEELWVKAMNAIFAEMGIDAVPEVGPPNPSGAAPLKLPDGQVKLGAIHTSAPETD